jgi:divalent metal cation (Fe/Co/Zn/Cd) transporter
MSDALKQSKNLIFFTILYNLIEGIFALSVGFSENSTALLSFGIDSFIEIFASAVALLGISNTKRINEETAERYIAYSFLILIFFILAKSSYDLLNNKANEITYIGIIIGAISILVEGPLAYKKFKLGRKLNNAVIIAEAKETLFCLNLSVLVIIGVGVNYFFDIWYFDPLAALFMIPWLFKEYREHK